MAPGGAFLANWLTPNTYRLVQRRSEERNARRNRLNPCNNFPDDEDERDYLVPLRQSPEFRGDHRGFHGHPRFERIAPHLRGDFADFEGSERVPWEEFHRHEPDLPARRCRYWRQHDFHDNHHDRELRNRNSRGSSALSPGPISHRHPSLFSDHSSDNYRSPGGDLSLWHDSDLRQRPDTHHNHHFHFDHDAHRGYSPNPHRHSDHRSRSQISWNSVAQHGRGGGINRVNGPMSPNRERTDQWSVHSGSSSDLTAGTVI